MCGSGGLTPPQRFFFFACQYMKIPTDLDPNGPGEFLRTWRIPRTYGNSYGPGEFLDPPLYKTSQSPTGLVGRASPYRNQPPPPHLRAHTITVSLSAILNDYHGSKIIYRAYRIYLTPTVTKKRCIKKLALHILFC